jgi:hypothetical protein
MTRILRHDQDFLALAKQAI